MERPDEDVFMQILLDGLDPAITVRTPTRTKCSPRKHKLADVSKDDLSILLDGAENWDWADMEADFMTPKKKTASPRKVSHFVLGPRSI